MADAVLQICSFIMWTVAAFVWGMVYHRDHYNKKDRQ